MRVPSQITCPGCRWPAPGSEFAEEFGRGPVKHAVTVMARLLCQGLRQPRFAECGWLVNGTLRFVSRLPCRNSRRRRKSSRRFCVTYGGGLLRLVDLKQPLGSPALAAHNVVEDDSDQYPH